MILIDNSQMSLASIVFSDESTFIVHGNRRYCYWTDHNPHWMQETHTHFPQKLNVWAGIMGDRILEPAFLDGNLDGEIYLRLLQEDLTQR
jgi:hypothetical protein